MTLWQGKYFFFPNIVTNKEYKFKKYKNQTNNLKDSTL